MNYLALYRKYRPNKFDDIFGQKYIVDIIKNSIVNNKFSHAYLFSGPRGTGKTSMAKIIAKTINCENLSDDAVACDKCNSCDLFNRGANPDIIEMDAASNNGIDEIRAIRDKVSLLPAVSKYKVYIVDEVHMLTTQAFNALLKTLEEPPSHVVFILATTELHKVPETIVSRCQCFEFKRVSDADVIKCLKTICKKEKISVDDDVLELIAKYSKGGVRDSIGLLDKLCCCSDNVTSEVFYDVMGIVDNDSVKKIIDIVAEYNVKKLFDYLEKLEKNGKNIGVFINQMMEYLKDEIINVKDDSLKKLYVDILDELNASYYIFNYSSDVLLNLEVVFLKIMNKNKGNDDLVVNEEVLEEEVVEKEEEREKSDIIEETESVEEPKVNVEKEVKNNEQKFEKPALEVNFDKVVNNAFALANKKMKNEIVDNWKGFYDYIHNREFSNVVSYFLDSSIQVVGEKDVIISSSSEAIIDNAIKNLPKMELLFNLVMGKFYNIAFIMDDEWERLKNQYIEDINNGKKYEYIEFDVKNSDIIKETNEEDSKNVMLAKDIFGEDVVEVK